MPSSLPARQRKASFLVLALALALPLAAQGGFAEAQRLHDQGRYEESRKLALEAIGANAGDIDSYVVLCADLLALERWADAQNYALKGYEKKRDPRLTEILGEAAYNLGNNEAALKLFQNYVVAVPEGSTLGRAYSFMGEIFLRKARYAHADIAFSTALQFVPGNARWWSRLGWAREKANDRTGALAAYRSALDLEPALEDALLGLSRVQGSNRG
jgi:tetratricopeptide (TPR) repeat protein